MALRLARKPEKNIFIGATLGFPSRLVTSQASALCHAFSMVPAEPKLESEADATFSSRAPLAT
jgi:hypothetical protein